MNHNKFRLSVGDEVWRDLDTASANKVTIVSFTKNFLFAEVYSEKYTKDDIYNTMTNRLFPIEPVEGDRMITIKPTISKLLNDKDIEVTYIKPYNDESFFVRTKENKETLVYRDDVKLIKPKNERTN